MNLFLSLAILSIFLGSTGSEKIEKINDLYSVFNTSPETIEYAMINITRERQIGRRAVCCINLLGETTVCSYDDLVIEYTGKLISKTLVFDCPQVSSVDYIVVRRQKIEVLLGFLIGGLTIIPANILLIYFIYKKIRSERLPTSDPTAASSVV